MTQTNLYTFLGIAFSASTQEVEAAIDAQYNNYRRLVNHHDPAMVNQANQALLTIEQARATLLDGQRRVAYDQSIGLGGPAGGQAGGLADPQAILNRLTGAPAQPAPMQPGMMPGGFPVAAKPPVPPGYPQAVVPPVVRMDVWICAGCGTPNPVGTRFCKQCGNQVGVDCPKCGKTMEATGQFCQDCGVNVREFAAQQEAERQQREMEAQMREAAKAEELRQKAELEARLGPVVKNSNNAWNLTLAGGLIALFSSCFPFGIVVSWLCWGGAIYYSRKVLNTGQSFGDTPYRKKAKNAFWWSVVPFGLTIALAVLAVVVLMIQYMTSYTSNMLN